MIQFLKYVKNSKSEIAAGSSRLEDLDNFFQILKGSKEVEDKYMNAKWYAEEAREEEKTNGIRNVIKAFKITNTDDSEIIKQLMKMYDLDREDAEDYLKEYYDER